MSGESCPAPQSNYDNLALIYSDMNKIPGGARSVANVINVGGYQYIMQKIFPKTSYGYINTLTAKIALDQGLESKLDVNNEVKGKLLKDEIMKWIKASRPQLEDEAENVTQEKFEAAYNNVFYFFNYLNDGVYLNIWNIAQKAAEEKAKPASGGKKKTRRRKKSKRKRKSRRARR